MNNCQKYQENFEFLYIFYAFYDFNVGKLPNLMIVMDLGGIVQCKLSGYTSL